MVDDPVDLRYCRHPWHLRKRTLVRLWPCQDRRTRSGTGLGRNPPGHLIARIANRFLGKADREALRFADLRHRVSSAFLVLPPNRLDAYSRWLRLLVSEALQDIARDAERPRGAERP